MEKAVITIRSRQDIIDFMNSGKAQSRNAAMIIVTALGGIFIDAYDFVSLGIGVQQLIKEFSLTSVMLGNLTASMAVGALLGALVGGYYTDKIGRLKMFYLNLLFFVVSAVAAALAPNYEFLMLCRFVMGLGIGMDFPVAMAFLAEFSSKHNNAKRVGMWTGVWYLAAICSLLVVLPFYFMGDQSNLWRWSVGFGAAPALVVFVLRYLYMDESPLWAANNKGLVEAARILEKTYYVQVVIDAPAEELHKKGEEITPDKILDLFRGKYLVRTTMVSIVAISQSLQFFAIGFYLPVISTAIFGKEIIYAIMGSIFFNFWGLTAGFSAGSFQQKFGTKKAVLFGYMLCFISLVVIGLNMQSISNYAAAALIVMFVVGHTLGPGTGGMAIAALSFPTEIRGTGCGWAQTMVRVGSIAGLYFFPLMRASQGIEKTFLYLAIVPLVAFIIISMIRWEPVGKDIESEALKPE